MPLYLVHCRWENSGTWNSQWFPMPSNCPKLVSKRFAGNFTSKPEWKKVRLIDFKVFGVYNVKAKLGDFVKSFPPGLVHNYLMKSICILSSFIVSCRHSIEAGPTLWGSGALLNCEVIWILEFCGEIFSLNSMFSRKAKKIWQNLPILLWRYRPQTLWCQLILFFSIQVLTWNYQQTFYWPILDS